MKKLLNLMMFILLVTIVGCTSDDNEGTFELPTKNVDNDLGLVSDTGSTSGINNTEAGFDDIALSLSGIASGTRILSSATVIAIDGAGSHVSSSVNSNGSFSLTGQEITAPFILFLVPGNSSGLNWEGDVQISIVTSTSKGSLVVNPITTAVALALFSENDFDLVAFAESVQNGLADESLVSEYNSILSNLTEDNINATLTSIVNTWGTSNSGSSLFSSDLFESIYTPRSSMRQVASYSHLLIEALGVNFGDNNLGQSIADYNGNGSSILLEKGFQEGIVFVLYSLNKYQPFGNFTVSTLLDHWITSSTTTISYETNLQLIVDELMEEEIGSNKSDAEIKAIIKTKIASENITF